MAKTYTTVPSKISGETFTLTNWSTHVRDNVNNLIVPPMCKAFLSTTQTISTAAFTAVSWDTEVFDTDSMWSNASPTRFTISTTGVYLLQASIYFAAGSGGIRALQWVKNGTTGLQQVYGEPISTNEAHVQAHTSAALTSGDYVEIKVFQNTGGSLNIGTTDAVGQFVHGSAVWQGKTS